MLDQRRAKTALALIPQTLEPEQLGFREGGIGLMMLSSFGGCGAKKRGCLQGIRNKPKVTNGEAILTTLTTSEATSDWNVEGGSKHTKET